MSSPMRLLKLIKPPSKLANVLDWNKAKSVAALDIGRERIGVAICSHPECGESIQTYEPVRVKLETRNGNRRALAKSVVKKLESAIRENNICGFVVNFPLQPSVARAGCAAGFTLFALERLVADSKLIITPNRPICLWANCEGDPECREDEWGRTPLYGRSTTKTFHRATTEQYFHHEGSSDVAAETWISFCERNWPEIWDDQQWCAGKQVSFAERAEQYYHRYVSYGGHFAPALSYA